MRSARLISTIALAVGVFVLPVIACAPDEESTPRFRGDSKGRTGSASGGSTDEETEELQASSGGPTSNDPDRVPGTPERPEGTPDGGGTTPTPTTTTPPPPPPPVNPCQGRANGFTIAGAGAANRCCGGTAVDLRSRNNCGACGIQCPGNHACEEVVPGQWGCRCTTNAECANSGYGEGATCYTPPGGLSFCNCQCAAAAPATCNDRCVGGATCNEVTGHNYCAYN